MILRKFPCILIIAFLFLSGSLFSQFTYLDVSIGNRFMKISKEKHQSYKSKYNQTNIQVNGLWRFKRHFGIGMTASIPIRQGGKYWIIAEDGYTISTIDLLNSVSKFDYYFKESAKVVFNGRLYGGVKGNFYLDARLSIFSFTEYLTANYTTMPMSYLEENRFNQFAPGFSIGMQPHLSKYMTMNINMGWDFYTFKDVGFRGTGNDGNTHLAHLDYYSAISFKSQLPEKKTAFSINIGLGYFF